MGLYCLDHFLHLAVTNEMPLGNLQMYTGVDGSWII